MLKINVNRLIKISMVVLATISIFNMSYAHGLVASNCSKEINKFCPNVSHGHGRVPDCLESHWKNLSNKCKEALDMRGSCGCHGHCPHMHD